MRFWNTHWGILKPLPFSLQNGRRHQPQLTVVHFSKVQKYKNECWCPSRALLGLHEHGRPVLWPKRLINTMGGWRIGHRHQKRPVPGSSKLGWPSYLLAPDLVLTYKSKSQLLHRVFYFHFKSLDLNTSKKLWYSVGLNFWFILAWFPRRSHSSLPSSEA